MDVSSGPVFLSKKRGGLAADVSSGLIFLKEKKNPLSASIVSSIVLEIVVKGVKKLENY